MDKKNNKENLKMEIAAGISVIAALTAMLSVTTYALNTASVLIEENSFQMGTVDISLNDGKKIFEGSDLKIEPGTSVKKDFTLKNDSTVDVYYRLYLENIAGSLKDRLIFQIYDGDEMLYSGLANDFTKDSPCVGDTALKAGEEKILTVVVKMQEDAGNEYQNSYISFDITADAVQVRNNPDKMFE